MRCMMKGLFVVVVAFGAGVVVAGPLDRNAASKANGDMVGQAATARAGNTYRSFSYSPAPTTMAAPRVAAAIPAPPVQAVPAAPVRRYSYQPQPSARVYYGNWQAVQPGYLRVDKKVLGY